MRLASSSPRVPVQALAQPEFAITARISPAWRARISRSTSTGAACTRLVVNTPAAVHGRSAASNARSGAPLGLSPHAVAAPWNPGASANGVELASEDELKGSILRGSVSAVSAADPTISPHLPDHNESAGTPRESCTARRL